MDNLKLGYGGTKTEMERLLADASKLSGVDYNIDNLGDVYDAIHVIQQDLGLTGVAALEASTTFTGSFNAMKASAENLMANLALGENIGPSLVTLGETVQAFLLNNLFPMVQNVLGQIPGLITGLAEMIVQAAPGFIEAGVSLVTSLVTSFTEHDWVGTGTGVIQGILDSITSKLPDLLSKGVEIITNIVNGIMATIPEMLKAWSQAQKSFIEFIVQNLPAILQKGKELLLNVAKGITSNLPQIASAAGETIKTLVSTLAEHLPEILQMGVTLILELVTGLLQCLPDVITAAADLAKSIIDAFLSIDWAELGLQLINGIINGIKSAGGALIDAAKGAAQSAFDAACDFLGINSPARKGIYIGEMLDAGFAEGISANSAMVDSAISGLSNDATARLSLATNSATFDLNTANNNKMDILLSMLSAYLPEIAENKGVSVTDLYNGINRQLGMALT